MAKLITPALGTIILSVIALIAVWTQQPLLAPSLGSAAFTQLLSPQTSVLGLTASLWDSS